MPSKETLEFIGKAVAVLAFLFTALSYANNLRLGQKTARYAEARALMTQYREAGVRAAEHAIFARSLYMREDGLDPNNPDNFPQAIYNAYANGLLFGVITNSEVRNPPLLNQFLDVADFYAEVSFCLTQSICDQEITRDFFCPRVSEYYFSNRRLFDYYSEYAQSQEWKNGISALLAQCDG